VQYGLILALQKDKSSIISSLKWLILPADAKIYTLLVVNQFKAHQS
jgi:hypothetical protein